PALATVPTARSPARAQQGQGGSHAEARRDAVGELGVPVVLGLAAAHTASLGRRLGQPRPCTPLQLTTPSARWVSCRTPPSPWRHRTCNPDERTNLMTTTSLNAPERSPHTTTTVAPVFALPLDDELDTSELEILQALAADGLLPDETEGVGHGGVLDDGGGAESYGGATESTQPDPEALPRHDGKASESFLQRFPLEDARCATDPVETDWVPSVEARVV